MIIQSIVLVSRTCNLCGAGETTVIKQIEHPIYYLPDRVPRANRCQRCGMHALLPGESQTVHIRAAESLDWNADRPHKGRPTNAELLERAALKAAARLVAEG